DKESGINVMGAAANSTSHSARSSKARLSVTTGFSTGMDTVFSPKLSSTTSSPSPAAASSVEPSDAAVSAAVEPAESVSELEHDANTSDAAATEATRA